MAKGEGSDQNGSPDFKRCADWLREVFPDAQALFDAEFKSVEAIKAECVVALDASVLLVPYEMDKQSLAEVSKVYAQLAESKRLIIPAQAAREFVKNRAAKVANIVKHLRDQSSRAAPLAKKIGFLEGTEGFQEAKELSNQIAELGKQLRERLEPIVTSLTDVVGDDPVSSTYRAHFKNCVRDISEEAAKKAPEELRVRYDRKTPPGYKDASKDDGGIGDLLIWKTLLQEGASQQRDMIFVTGEEKSDWYTRMDGSALQPRVELLEEYRAASGGKTLHLLALSTLLKAFGAQEAAVEQAQRIEEEEEGRRGLVVVTKRSFRHPLTGEFIPRAQLKHRQAERVRLQSLVHSAIHKIEHLREEMQFYIARGEPSDSPLIRSLQAQVEDAHALLDLHSAQLREYEADPDLDDE